VSQFSKALASIKDAIPQALLLNGHNPLTMLHKALSTGLHEKTDEECLEIAHDVRVVLIELADRLGQLLKDGRVSAVD
jgi:(p)ppGpp synthase/HD superfamily hydrolase